MNLSPWRCAILVASAFIAILPATLEGQGETVRIRNATLVDVRTGRLHPGTSVLIRGDTIADVGPDNTVRGGSRVVQAAGKYLVPGLVDSHAHIWQPWNFNWPDSIANLGWILASGVTTVRDAGSGRLEGSFVGLRNAIKAGAIEGPRLVLSGAMWRVMELTGARDMAPMLQEYPRIGFDQVKVYGEPRELRLQIIRAARSSGLAVYGHTNGFVNDSMVDEFALDAIDAGISGLAHSSGKSAGGVKRDLNLRGWLNPDTLWLRQLITKAVSRGVWLEPTLSVTYASNSLVYGRCTDGFDVDRLLEYYPFHQRPQQRPNAADADTARIICANHWKFVRDFHAAGGMIVAGADFVPFAPLGVVGEMRLLVAAGLSPLASLQAATVNAARAVGLEDQVGVVERGKRADLLLLDANPLEDIRAIEKISTLIAAGRVVDVKKLWARKGTTPSMLAFNEDFSRLSPEALNLMRTKPDSLVEFDVATNQLWRPGDERGLTDATVISASPGAMRVRMQARWVRILTRVRFVDRVTLVARDS